MKTTLVILASLALALTIPSSASATGPGYCNSAVDAACYTMTCEPAGEGRCKPTTHPCTLWLLYGCRVK